MRKGRIVVAGILAVAMLLLWGSLFLRVRNLTEQYSGFSVRFLDAALTQRQLTKLLDQKTDNGLTCTAAWTRSTQTALSAESFESSARARIITIHGDMRQTAAMALISGSYPMEDDYEGCLVTADVAMTLFHSVEAIGAQVEIAGKRFLVRGVVEAYEPMLLIRSDTASYKNLEFSAADVSMGKQQMQQLIYQCGLSSDYVVVQNGLYARILYGFAFLPLALVLLWLFVFSLKACRRHGAKLQTALWLISAAAAITALCMVLRKTFYWPQIFLPTKCSDFEFWGNLISGWRETWKAIQLMPPLPKEILFFQQMRACSCTIAVILMIQVYLITGVKRNFRENIIHVLQDDMT